MNMYSTLCCELEAVAASDTNTMLSDNVSLVETKWLTYILHTAVFCFGI